MDYIKKLKFRPGTTRIVPRQHAYIKGKSTEPALEPDQYALVSFLDVLIACVSLVRNTRVIRSTLEDTCISRTVYRGTPHGGVISPLLMYDVIISLGFFMLWVRKHW